MTIPRRDFTKLVAAAGAGGLLVGLAPGTAHADTAAPSTPGTVPAVTETELDITVDNGRLVAVFNKQSSGRLEYLSLDGQELLGEQGRGRFDQNGSALEGTPVTGGPTTYTVHRGADWVRLQVVIQPSTGNPYFREWNYVLRTGETVIHLAPRFHHPAELPDVRIDQHRFVCWVDPQIFTHASLEEDPFGEPWRADAAELPTPADLQAGPMVMDATHDLQGVGSRYARRYYTKYDWAVSMRDHQVHGLYGQGPDGKSYGLWAAYLDLETFNGGPDRNDLTLHQTTSAPVLLLEPQATHYNMAPIMATDEWSKTYGPYLFVATQGADGPTMRAEVEQMAADRDRYWDFYDEIGLEGWTPTRQRAEVTGKVHVKSDQAVGPATVVLSDNGVDVQDTVHGYQYWAETDDRGRFSLDGVRPGRYRLTVQQPGCFGAYVRDDVEIGRRHVHLPTVTWTPPSHGRTLWQIGTPDGTSAEFRGGAEARSYLAPERVVEEFPDGVRYEVGRSDDDDWYYTQLQQVDGQPVKPFEVVFDLDQLPRDGKDEVTLTIALAAWSLHSAVPAPNLPSTLNVRFNGNDPLVWEFPGPRSGGAVYRSTNRARNHYRELTVPLSTLRRGRNVMTLSINDGITGTINQGAYDALRLEVGKAGKGR